MVILQMMGKVFWEREREERKRKWKGRALKRGYVRSVAVYNFVQDPFWEGTKYFFE